MRDTVSGVAKVGSFYFGISRADIPFERATTFTCFLSFPLFCFNYERPFFKVKRVSYLEIII